MKSKIAFSVVIFAFVILFVTASFAANDNTRPGCGYGDENHEHVGPPGQSAIIPPTHPPYPTPTYPRKKKDNK
ncbi:MAG: hypothetical protein KAS07_02355 [Candidatus Pacebacteria bacterium]|nr:hypothetical protein [Candidatus Paceibacterota bacterium]